MEPIDLLIKEVGEHRVKYNEDLSYYLFRKDKVKGKFFFIATNQRELLKVLNLCFELKIPYLIFGSGSKIVLDKKRIEKLVIRNRSSGIKVVGIKGKMGNGNLGLDEAKVEIDSGVVLDSLNEYLDKQGLKRVVFGSPGVGTVGGSLLIDPSLRERTEKVKVWLRGEEEDIPVQDLDGKHVVLSATLVFKSVASRL